MSISDSSFLEHLHEIKGTMTAARESFYELAKKRVRIMGRDEYSKWINKLSKHKLDDMAIKERPAIVRYSYGYSGSKEEKQKWVQSLEIGINGDAFKIDGADYSDIIPFVIEHEIYEAWLGVKKGVGDGKMKEEDLITKHLLAMRREFLLAEEQGLAEKLFEWRMGLYPSDEEDYMNAWNKAKKRLGR